MHSMLPSLRAGADRADASSGGPEFEAALKDLRAARPLRDARLIAVARQLTSGHIAEGKAALSAVLARHPSNPDALNLMAEIAGREGHYREAELQLSRCVKASPSADYYRYNYILALEKLSKLETALAETAVLLRSNPHQLIFRNLQALLLKKMGNDRSHKIIPFLPICGMLLGRLCAIWAGIPMNVSRHS
jgi:predicted Zn-dependent protease